MTTNLAPGIVLAQKAPPAGAHDHSGHSAPPPESIGGAFALVDLNGTAVTSENIKGKWTLLFFGYSRCTASCSLAIPTIVEAARMLNKSSVAARAVLIDIDMPPVVPVRRRTAPVPAQHTMEGHSHGTGDSREAMRKMASRFGNDLVILTGSRRQLNDAIIAFRVNREHVPARKGETGHSINHSSLVHFIAPDGTMAGYSQPDVQPHALVSAVQELAAS
jgi:cytochrome oxidase Cu insertion factor (SCO1/SenC/PrrC family)